MKRLRFVLGICLLGALATVTSASATESRVPFLADGVGMFDPGTGEWHLRAADGYSMSFYFGNPGDTPFMGDWDCDGVDTPGLYRQSDGFVYLRNSNTHGIANIRFFFGNPGDVPLAGDFDGDDCDTVSLYRPSESRVFVINQLGSDDRGLGPADIDYALGDPGDTPFVGDFDGDGTDTIGLHRGTTGLVYFRNSHDAGPADSQFVFGDPDDRPIAGDWTGDRIDTPGAFRPGSGRVFLRHTNTAGLADENYRFGTAAMTPIAGDFGLAAPGFAERSWDVATIEGTSDQGWFASLASGADGKPIISHGLVTRVDKDPGSQDLQRWGLAFTKCLDYDCVTSSTVLTARSLSDHTSLTIGSDSLPVASFHEYDSFQLLVAHCEDAFCSSVAYSNASAPPGSVWHERFGVLGAIGRATDGSPYIAYLNTSTTAYWLAKCVDVRCAASSAVLIGDAGTFHRIATTLSTNGTPIIVRMSSRVIPDTYTLEYRECVDAACTSSTGNTLAAWPSTTGGTWFQEHVFPAVAIGADDLPMVAFNNNAVQRAVGEPPNPVPSLDVVHCLDSLCADFTRTTIDEGFFDSVSIAIGTDGLPIVAYNGIDGLKVAHCDDLACTTAVVKIVTAGADVGHYASMVVDPLGMPIVAFRDGASGTLKVARLGD